MSCASQLLRRHSNKLRNGHNILQHEPAGLIHYFCKDVGGYTGKLDGSKTCGMYDEKVGDSSLFISTFPVQTMTAKCGSKSESFGIFKIFAPGMSQNALSRMSSKFSISMTSISSSCIQAAQRRYYSSNSDLPSHQEIGMPSLSPTMTEGNVARWLKKEGDKVSPGEVLCEIETDKATVEMECMEEGYIAKIIHGDGAQNIKVGGVSSLSYSMMLSGNISF